MYYRDFDDKPLPVNVAKTLVDNYEIKTTISGEEHYRTKSNIHKSNNLLEKRRKLQ